METPRLFRGPGPALARPFAVLVALLAACSGGPQGDSAGAGRALERGLELEARDQLAQAADAFREAIRLDPALAEAHLQLGRTLETMCYIRVGRGGEAPTAIANVLIGRDGALLDEAIEHLGQASELEPQNAEHAYFEGRALYLRGRDEEAIEELERAIRLDPSYGAAHKRLGTVLLDYGEPEAALASLRRAATLMSNDGSIHFHIGNILQEDDPAGARAAYEQAIAIDRTSPWTYNGLAAVLERLGEHEGAARARQDFEIWQDLDTQLEAVSTRARRRPDNLEAQIEAGELYFAVELPRKALGYFRRAAALAPEEPLVHLYLGLILAQSNPSRGRMHLEKCLQFVPDAAQPKIELLRIGIATNDAALVSGTLERITAEVDGWDADDRLGLANALLESGRRSKAETHYEAVLALEPDNEEAAEGLARARTGAPR